MPQEAVHPPSIILIIIKNLILQSQGQGLANAANILWSCMGIMLLHLLRLHCQAKNSSISPCILVSLSTVSK